MNLHTVRSIEKMSRFANLYDNDNPPPNYYRIGRVWNIPLHQNLEIRSSHLEAILDFFLFLLKIILFETV